MHSPMQTPLELVYQSIDRLIKSGCILRGEVRMSFTNHGRHLRVWVGADQIINGRSMRMVPLRNPKSQIKLVASEYIIDGNQGAAFDRACITLVQWMKAALECHVELMEDGKPTWGHDYSLKSSSSAGTD